MKLYTRLDNKLAYQLFEFIRPRLIDVYSGKVIKPATRNSKELRFTYSYLIKKMTRLRPQFLINFIYENNPDINKDISIPFNILHSTLEALLKEFIKTLFTELDYTKILTSYNSVPPYAIAN